MDDEAPAEPDLYGGITDEGEPEESEYMFTFLWERLNALLVSGHFLSQSTACRGNGRKIQEYHEYKSSCADSSFR
jgi:hypothetical protein